MASGRRIVSKYVPPSNDNWLRLWPPYRFGSADFQNAFPLAHLSFDPVDAVREVGFSGLTSRGWRRYFIAQWLKENSWVEDYLLGSEVLPGEDVSKAIIEIADIYLFGNPSEETSRVQKLRRALDIARSHYIM